MVGVDWPMKVPLHIQLYRKNGLSSHRFHFVKNYFFSTKLLQVKYWINSAKAVLEVDQPMKASNIYTDTNMFLKGGILWKQRMHQRYETRVCIFSGPD